MRFQSLTPLLCLILSLQGIWASPIARTPQVSVELISEPFSPNAQGSMTVALYFKPEPGWHIYWSNPGDSGMPPSVNWQLPPGFTAGPLQFPFPERILAPPLVSYGYEHETILVTEITPAPGWKPTPITLKAEVDWLVCKEACLPGHASLDLTLASHANPQTRNRIEGARLSLPISLPSKQLIATAKPGFLELLVSTPSPSSKLSFFPDENDWLDDFQPTQTEPEGSNRLLRLPLKKNASIPTTLNGVLVSDSSWDAAGHRAIKVSVPTATPPAKESKSANLVLTFLFAFLGGLILNIMPCVFPILSLKALHLVQISGESRSAARREGIAFGAGVLLSLLALAGLLLLLRASGHALGWGFQLQSPPVVWLLLVLLFTLSINLLGLFEFPVLLSGLASKNAGHGWTGAFASGLLAVAVASPCTAPFMGVALAAAFALPGVGTLLIFSSLALGFASPVLLFSCFPALLSFLPKPGSWMNSFKKILSIPMFAAVAWLIWVLLRLCGSSIIVLLLLSGLLLSVGLILYGRAQQTYPPRKGWKLAALLLFLFSTVGPALTLKTATTEIAVAHPDRIPWSEEEFTRQIANGRTVFIDFTAAWCLTCQVNERVTLSRAEIQNTFRQRNVAFLVADWTRRDPAITAALHRYGREGVPTYVLLRPDGSAPKLLPEILTPALVLEAIK